MIKELDTIVLAKDLRDYHLKRGDVGAVVHVYEGGKAFEVEFVTGEGETVAVVTLSASEIRSMRSADILHVRSYATV
jgi:hypothetical protein